MNPPYGRPTGVSDAELIRYLDGELAGDERARVESALAADAAVARRLDALRGQSDRLRRMLAALEADAAEGDAVDHLARAREAVLARAARAAPAPEAAGRRHAAGLRAVMARPALLRAAAAIALLLGVTLGVAPVRAWVGGQWERVVALLGGPAPDAAQAPGPAAAPVAPGAGFVIGFAVEGDTFDIEVAAAQPAGRLTIGVHTLPGGTAERSGAAGGGDFLVLPRGLRIRNDARSTADYRVTLPRSLRVVRVRIGEAPAVAYHMGQDIGPAELVIELGPR